MELIASSTFNESTLANLEAGVYLVVTQQTGECPVVESSVILTQPEAITLNPDIEAPTCSYTNDGSIHLNPEGGNGEFSYEWSTGENQQSISNMNTGYFSVTVTDVNGCQRSTEFEISAVYEPRADFEVETTHVLTGGIAVVPFENSSEDADNYLWIMGDGSITGEENPTHVYNETGIFTVTLEATSGECTKSKSKDILIEVIQSTEENAADNMEAIFTANGLRVKNLTDGTWNIRVYNVLGQLITDTNVNTAKVIQLPTYMNHILVEAYQPESQQRISWNLAR
ncbi:MAG: PKD domain-containing protein [Flavobacteriales bacterium]|nr:PKD domain-containing protein [Flavobacteriales bacterium]